MSLEEKENLNTDLGIWGECYVKLEAETVGCCHELSNTRSLQAGRGEKGFFPRAFRGSMALLTP